MAVTITSGLYPPIVDTFQNAFPTVDANGNANSAKVYFSLSPYNSQVYYRIHVTVTSQSTNTSALATNRNPAGILSINANNVKKDDDIGLYYIEIPAQELRDNDNGKWQYNQFYKVQLRLDSYGGNDFENTAAYYLDKLNYFSEWSTVTLLRPISKPTVVLRGFDSEDGQTTASYNRGIVPISGFLSFDNADETETLKSYACKLIDEEDNTVFTSDTTYTANSVNPNAISFDLDLNSYVDNIKLKMRIVFETKNLYESYKDYDINLIEYQIDEKFLPEITTSFDNDNGIVNIHIYNEQSVYGTLRIYRSSNVTNFKEFEELYSTYVTSNINLDIKDNTVGSGIWYKYSVQLQNVKGIMSEPYYSEEIFPDFYDAIITRGKRQIKLRYNYNISSMKPVVNRQKLDTLGGKYPRFAENAAMNYKQFSISGLISTEADNANLFLTSKEYFDDEYGNYLDYNDNNAVVPSYDYFWERGFRESLIKWLNDGEPKLYRSKTEGIFCIMLTDISLTPNATLSRRLWDFSATMYEIAEGDSLDDLYSSGIADLTRVTAPMLDIGGNVPTYDTIEIPGQILSKSVSEIDGANKGDIVANYIIPKLKEKFKGINEKTLPKNIYLKNVKIYFESQPHMYSFSGGQLTEVTSLNSPTQDYLNTIQMGYKFEINSPEGSVNGNTIFFVNKKGYYQIPSKIKVNSLYFPNDSDIVTIEYILSYEASLNTSTLPSTTSIDRTIIGQENGDFTSDDSIGDIIKNKYNVVLDNVEQQMQYWKGISIDAEPFTVINIKYHNSDDYSQYVIGFTGILNLLKDFEIDNLYFSGKKMHKVDYSRQRFCERWEYVLNTSKAYDEDSDIKKPLQNVVYNVNDKYEIFLDGYFYDFDIDTEIADIPINGSINYYANIISKEY